ncbi:phenylacetate--CoA ligase family protein [Candidatus Nitrospira bockiana]
MPLYELQAERKIRERVREIEGLQWLSPQGLQAYQQERFAQLIHHVAKDVPYYQRVFKEQGILASDIQRPEDLRYIPVLTKQTIVEHGQELVAGSAQGKPLELRQTGGSTGPSMKIYYDRAALDLTAAVNIRNLSWTGKHLGDREVHITNANPNTPQFRDKVREAVKCHFLNRVNIFVLNLGEAGLDHLWKALRRARPVLVQAYPTILASLAEHVQRHGGLSAPLFRVAEVTGETLFEWQRTSIEKELGCKVFNRYGLAEFGIIAHECEAHSGLHVNADTVILECLDGNRPVKPGEIGELVITGLTNYAMPLIRYRTGDCARVLDKSCVCGRGFPLVSDIQGRVHDRIQTPRGGHLYGHFFQDLMLAIGGVRRFQIIQMKLDQLVVKIVPGDGFADDTRKRIDQCLREALGDGINVDLQVVSEIDTTKTGKYRYTVCQMS